MKARHRVQALQAIFRTEVDAQLLGEMLEAIYAAIVSQPVHDARSPQQSTLQQAAAETLPVQQAAAAHPSTPDAPDHADVSADMRQQHAPAAAESHAASTHELCSFATNSSDGHKEEVVGMLQALCQAGRFSLARQLMPAKGQQAAASIFEWLQQQPTQAGGSATSLTLVDLNTLRTKYGIPAGTHLPKP
jgi:hypothetical protein